MHTESACALVFPPPGAVARRPTPSSASGGHAVAAPGLVQKAPHCPPPPRRGPRRQLCAGGCAGGRHLRGGQAVDSAGAAQAADRGRADGRRYCCRGGCALTAGWNSSGSSCGVCLLTGAESAGLQRRATRGEVGSPIVGLACRRKRPLASKPRGKAPCRLRPLTSHSGVCRPARFRFQSGAHRSGLALAFGQPPGQRGVQEPRGAGPSRPSSRSKRHRECVCVYHPHTYGKGGGGALSRGPPSGETPRESAGSAPPRALRVGCGRRQGPSGRWPLGRLHIARWQAAGSAPAWARARMATRVRWAGAHCADAGAAASFSSRRGAGWKRRESERRERGRASARRGALRSQTRSMTSLFWLGSGRCGRPPRLATQLSSAIVGAAPPDTPERTSAHAGAHRPALAPAGLRTASRPI